MRHPLYASVIAFGFAWLLVWQSGPGLALAVVQAGRRVPRFLPRLLSKTNLLGY